MHRFLVFLTLVPLLVSALPAQELAPVVKRVPPEAVAQADSLREVAVCPTDVAWPDFPESVTRIFTVDPAAVADSADLDRPDIQVPQYAYVYRPHDGVCEPVVVVQAQGSVFGHVSVLEQRPGATFEVFYDLLGTEKPVEPTPGGESSRFSRDSPPHFRFVICPIPSLTGRVEAAGAEVSTGLQV